MALGSECFLFYYSFEILTMSISKFVGNNEQAVLEQINLLLHMVLTV